MKEICLQRVKTFIAAIWIAILVLGALLLVTAPRILAQADAVVTITPLSWPTAGPPTPTVGTLPTASATVAPVQAAAAATPSPTATPVPAINLPGTSPNYDPLTGLTVSDANRLQRRPIAVKVVHYPRTVRPHQSGLTLADAVFEYYIEDGITRFIAVFYGNDAERAGPVRSGRYFDEHVARMYQSFLVYASADDRVNDYLFHTDLAPRLMIPGQANCPPLCRDTSIPGFNNVFLNTYLVGDWAARRARDNSPPHFQPTFFGPAPGWSARSAARVYVWYSGYSYHFWEYRPDMGRYLRYSDLVDAVGTQAPQYEIQRDALTGLPVMADNLVVLFVPHGFNNHFDADDQVFRIDLMDSGRAILFREGQAYEARWKRTAIDQPLVLTDPAGNLLPRKPGNTFYIVLPTEATLVENTGEWRFVAHIPGFGE